MWALSAAHRRAEQQPRRGLFYLVAWFATVPVGPYRHRAAVAGHTGHRAEVVACVAVISVVTQAWRAGRGGDLHAPTPPTVNPAIACLITASRAAGLISIPNTAAPLG